MKKLLWISIFTNMKLQWIYKLFSLSLLLISIQICGQNTISVKKTYPTIEAIFKSADNHNKLNQYYCFKKNGYVYYFTSSLKDKKIIQNCKEHQWLKMNSSPGKYIYYQDSITISPITYSMYGKETSNDFFYLATLDSISLNVSAIGKKEKKLFKLLFPNPIIIQK